MVPDLLEIVGQEGRSFVFELIGESLVLLLQLNLMLLESVPLIVDVALSLVYFAVNLAPVLLHFLLRLSVKVLLTFFMSSFLLGQILLSFRFFSRSFLSFQLQLSHNLCCDIVLSNQRSSCIIFLSVEIGLLVLEGPVCVN
jgi:hypothetical protein